MKLQTQIDSYHFQNDEFLVLVPFAKKEPTRTEEQDFSNVAPSSSTSYLADSTWSNIMEDLSHLRKTTEETSDNASNFELRKEKLAEKKQIELPYHQILNTLDCNSDCALGEHNCEVFSKILESVNCLSDLPLGQCKLFRRACLKGVCGIDGGGVTCLCPPWLKIVVKAFAFINIFSAFLHLQHWNLTTCLLEEALDQFAKFGVKLGLHDMKHLSLLCPNVNELILFLCFIFFMKIYFFHLILKVVFYTFLLTL